MLKWRFEQSCISDRQLKSADICYSFLVIRILAKVPASLVFSMLSDCAEVWISPDILHPLTANLLVAMATEQTLMIKISPCWKWAEEFREQLLTFWLQTRLSGSLCDCRTGKLILYCVVVLCGLWLVFGSRHTTTQFWCQTLRWWFYLPPLTVTHSLGEGCTYRLHHRCHK